jgi:hypothetical protein
MTTLHVVKNVINNHTKELGELQFISYKLNKEAREQAKDTDYRFYTGLVVYFQKLGYKKPQKLMSFILTDTEVKNILMHKSTIAKDGNYIITFCERELRMYNMGSYRETSASRTSDKGDEIIKVGEFHFIIEHYNEEKVKEARDLDMTWGIMRAIQRCLWSQTEAESLVHEELPIAYCIYNYEY